MNSDKQARERLKCYKQSYRAAPLEDQTIRVPVGRRE